MLITLSRTLILITEFDILSDGHIKRGPIKKMLIVSLRDGEKYEAGKDKWEFFLHLALCQRNSLSRPFIALQASEADCGNMPRQCGSVELVSMIVLH
jgi:hypothetical protein